jgi:hypothetical protein
VDDLGASLALRLGLAGDRALHRARDADVRDLDRRDLDAPRLGPLVDDLPEILVEPLALAEQRVEIRFAEHGAQRGPPDARHRAAVPLRETSGRVGSRTVASLSCCNFAAAQVPGNAQVILSYAAFTSWAAVGSRSW